MEKEKLYTVVWDYRGGSYSNQIRALSAESSFKKWMTIRLENKENLLLENDVNIVKEEFDYELVGIVPLNGLINVWSGDFSIGKNYLSVTIIETVE